MPSCSAFFSLILHGVMDSGLDDKSNCKPEVEARNGMDRLPGDISLNILSRLPVTSLVQSRSVSRAWHKLSQEVSLLNLHLSRIAENDPCLIFHCENPTRNQLYFVEFSHPCAYEKVRKINTPSCTSMPDRFDVLGSCNGLLCLSDVLHNDPLYIYNPFTGKHKGVPKSRQFQEQTIVAGFGFHPTTGEYKVVKMVYYRDPYTGPLPRPILTCGFPDYPHSEVQIYSLGNDTWRSIGSVPHYFQRQALEHFQGSSNDLLLLNGRLHWVNRAQFYDSINRQIYYGLFNGQRLYGLNDGQIIVSFDLSDERFRQVPGPACGGLDRPNYVLAILGGCLSAAVYSKDGRIEIWVMKEYDVQESWVKEFDIEAYVTNAAVLRQPPSHGIWKNKVLRGKTVRILCRLKNGDILLEFRDGNLASYDPESGKTANLLFEGMPKLFQTIVHVGSLNWIDLPLPINT